MSFADDDTDIGRYVRHLEAALERYRSGAEQQKAWRARTDEALRRFERPLGVPTWEVAAEWVSRAEVAEAALEVSVPLAELEQIGTAWWDEFDEEWGFTDALSVTDTLGRNADGTWIYKQLGEPVYRRLVAPVVPESEDA